MGAYGSPEHLGYIKHKTPLNKCPVCKLEYRGPICPQCGTPTYSPYQTKRKNGTPIYKRGWFWAVLAVIVFFMAQPHGNAPTRTVPIQQNPNTAHQNQIVQTPQAINEDSGTITLTEFNQLQDGMSYSDVAGIVGSEGVVDSQTDIDDMHLITYHWNGNDDYSQACIEFENDKLIGKTQAGLK